MSKPAEQGIEPVHVTDDCWLYGEWHDLVVVKELRDAEGNLEQTVIINVPWAEVSRARGRRPMKVK